MRVRWENIIIAAFLFAAFTITVLNLQEISAFLENMEHIGSRYSSRDERTAGLVAFALVGIFIVAVVRIVLASKNDN